MGAAWSGNGEVGQSHGKNTGFVLEVRVGGEGIENKGFWVEGNWPSGRLARYYHAI